MNLRPDMFSLRRVRLDAQGYESGRYYFGHGAPLWRVMSEDGAVTETLRACDREAAKAAFRAMNPGARFYR